MPLRKGHQYLKNLMSGKEGAHSFRMMSTRLRTMGLNSSLVCAHFRCSKAYTQLNMAIEAPFEDGEIHSTGIRDSSGFVNALTVSTSSIDSHQQTPVGDTSSYKGSSSSTPFKLNTERTSPLDKGKQRADTRVEMEVLPQSSGLKRRSSPTTKPQQTAKRLRPEVDSIDTTTKWITAAANSAGPSSLMGTPCSAWTPLLSTPQRLPLQDRHSSATEARLSPNEKRKMNLKSVCSFSSGQSSN